MSKLTFLLAALLLLCACSGPRADISAYGDTPITIVGLLDEEFTVTPNQLAALDCINDTARGATAKAGTVTAQGPLLDTFLAQYGKTPGDFEKIRFTASDGYVVVLKGKYLTDYQVILVLSNGDKPLSESCQPLRIVIPRAESSMWEYAVVRIEFISAENDP